MNGLLENNQLYDTLKKHINGRVMQHFLQEKYHWTTKVFANIDWMAQQRELQKLPRSQRTTLLKYIHGWLATKRRRHRERQSPNAICSLCGSEEARQHILWCRHDQITSIREKFWGKLLSDMVQHTTSEFRAIFTLGLQTILGGEHPTIETIQGWPEPIKLAYETQTEIGWDQLLYGRFAIQWDGVAEYCPQGVGDVRTGVWTQKAVRLAWGFGMEMWKIRNQVVHGAVGGISLLEKEQTKTLILLVYRELKPQVSLRVDEVFDRTEEDLLMSSHQTQAAWIGKIKFLYPRIFKELEARHRNELNETPHGDT